MRHTVKRYAVYPAKKAVEALGSSIPSLNQAVECWAALIARAMARNADTFWNSSHCSLPVDVGFDDEHQGIDEWCLLAELLKDIRVEPEFPNPGELLRTAFEDAQTLEKVGQKWFRSEFDGELAAKGLERAVKGLAEKLRTLDYVHAWALITAVQWYWDHNERIDFRKDPWWTHAFRRQPDSSRALQRRTKKKRATGAMARAGKRFAIYPAPRAVEVVGGSIPALNQAIECWAALVARATADNARVFREPDLDGDDQGFAEWTMLAEVLKGMKFEAEFMNPSGLIASAVEDAHRLENLGSRFLVYVQETTVTSIYKDRQPEFDDGVLKLVAKLRSPSFDYVHAWAVIVAVRWYWDHVSKIEPLRDPWWTLQFRRSAKGMQIGDGLKGGARKGAVKAKPK
jgi:hypothetical protein